MSSARECWGQKYSVYRCTSQKMRELFLHTVPRGRVSLTSRGNSYFRRSLLSLSVCTFVCTPPDINMNCRWIKKDLLNTEDDLVTSHAAVEPQNISLMIWWLIKMLCSTETELWRNDIMPNHQAKFIWRVNFFFTSPHAAGVMPLTLLAIALSIALFSVCNVEVWRERRFLICSTVHGGCWNDEMRSVCTSLLPSLISLVLCCPTRARRNVWKRWIMAQLKPDHKDWSGCSISRLLELNS